MTDLAAPQTTRTGSGRISQGPRLRWVLVLTSAAFFMTCLDSLVVATALPRIQESLHVSFASLQWTVNAYNIALAAGIICAAALGDRYGRRRFFVVGLLLFTVASAACAVAPNAALLIGARTVQGLGGAIILPLSLTILTGAFPAERRAAVFGIYGGLAGLAVALGPIVGGAVTQGLDWHWVFWVNVPIGIAAAILSLRLLPESFGPRIAARPHRGGARHDRARRLVWGLVRANDAGLDEHRDRRRRSSSDSTAAGRLRRLGGAGRASDALAGPVAHPRVRGRECRGILLDGLDLGAARSSRRSTSSSGSATRRCRRESACCRSSAHRWSWLRWPASTRHASGCAGSS